MGVTYGKYCGLRSGKTVLVTGSRASFHFHSDSSVQRKGFRLYLSIVSLGKSLLNFPPVKTKRFSNDPGLSNHCICTYKKYHCPCLERHEMRSSSALTLKVDNRPTKRGFSTSPHHIIVYAIKQGQSLKSTFLATFFHLESFYNMGIF